MADEQKLSRKISVTFITGKFGISIKLGAIFVRILAIETYQYKRKKRTEKLLEIIVYFEHKIALYFLQKEG